MYFMAQVPDTIDSVPNANNKRNGFFEVSPAKISDTTGLDITAVQRGITNLINKGYLTQRRGNLYNFIDLLPEDKSQTIQEHEIVLEYEEQLRNSINDLQQQRDQQLKEIAQENISKERKLTEEEYMKEAREKGYSWA